ncbi:DNA-binding CsgD family transcriptional regulator [Kitasatospora sp. MAP12-15]|uniref:helix-turn-helix transcriptional regulator n=1 Tax=unclassified Kitasatospora TaxID=2633591 RepID=UPI002473FEB7|nr:LuxR family transcriptional regulator [Kitasatospora sp. MAP12-44]MDH6110677.1 DNA-binding CsgD family transcriptional regulator [Kitasatospora sp. MAP12-44]
MSDDVRDGGRAPLPLAGARIRQLFGRDAEVAALRAALDGLASSGGRAIALIGEPGIGKSALMSTAAAHARTIGVQVHAAHGQEAIGPWLPGVRPPAGNRDLHRLAAHGKQPRAALVAVDDLHHLTADRIPGLERLIHTAAADAVLCLLAYRQRQLSPTLAAVLSRAASAGRLEVWNLGPLSRDQARELLGDRPDADEVYRASLGIPQYLEIIAAGSAGSAAGTEAGTAILGELACLHGTALTVLQAAAILGEQFHPDLLAAVAGLEMTETMAALDALTHLDLVRPAEPAPQLTLRHRAVGEVVYQRLEPSRRITMHQRAEAALAERAAPITRRAHHIARAADPGRPEHVTALIAAARNSLHASPGVAADFLQTALSLLQEGEAHWHEAQVLLARTRLLTGDASESRALLDALRVASPRQPSPDLTTLADASRAERRLGRYTEAGAIARAGLAALADHDSATAAALHAELADYTYDLQDYQTSRQHAETAAAIARGHHDSVGEAKALAQASLGQLFTSDQATALSTAAKAAELIDATCDATLLTNLEAISQLGMTEGILGRLADAERHLTRGAALSRHTGQVYIQPAILMALANTQLRSGNLRDALATLDESTRHAAQASMPAIESVRAMLRSEVLLWLNSSGDLREVVTLADRAMAIADGQPTAWAVTVRCFHAELVLLTGDQARAGRLLLEAAGGVGLPRLATWRKPRCCEALVQAALAAGDQASVEQWTRLAETCVDELPSVGRRGFARRARMRAHAMRGETERALHSAQGAIADFSSGGERIETCRTLLAAAELSLEAGRREQADGWLDRAAALARQCDSARLADEVARLRRRLAAESGPTSTPASLAMLTARERQIAYLTSTGMTSGVIADTLSLSVRTVDSHLGRIYRKLGVSNRASLTRSVLSAAPDPQ